MKKKYGDKALPLFVVSSSNTIEPFSLDNPPSPQAGDTIIGLVSEDADSKNPSDIETDQKLDPNLPH